MKGLPLKIKVISHRRRDSCETWSCLGDVREVTLMHAHSHSASTPLSKQEEEVDFLASQRCGYAVVCAPFLVC